MLKTRNRLVNFRVTEDEYEGLRASCSQSGARCLSDYARSVILDTGGGAAERAANGRSAVDERIGDVERRIATIETNLERLLTAVSAKAAAHVAS